MPKLLAPDSDRIHLRIPPELKAQFAAEADRRGQSLSAFMISAARAQLPEANQSHRTPQRPR